MYAIHFLFESDIESIGRGESGGKEKDRNEKEISYETSIVI